MHEFAAGIVDRHGRGAARLRIVRGKLGGLEQGLIADLLPQRLDYDVRTVDILGMQPDIVGCRGLEGQPVVLRVVFADIDIRAVRGDEMQGLGRRQFKLFCGIRANVDIASEHQFVSDLVKIGIGHAARKIGINAL